MLKPLLSVVLACASAILFHFALEAYSNIATGKEQLRALSVRSQAVEQYKQDAARAKPILARMQHLACKARSTGVSELDWNRYDVDIKESVSFPDAGRVIAPAVNSSSYYFKPTLLEIKKSGVVFESHDQQEGVGLDAGEGGAVGDASGQEVAAEMQPQEETMGGDTSTGSGDMELTLKGSFLVKRSQTTQ